VSVVQNEPAITGIDPSVAFNGENIKISVVGSNLQGNYVGYIEDAVSGVCVLSGTTGAECTFATVSV
jgi:hypothetical protein